MCCVCGRVCLLCVWACVFVLCVYMCVRARLVGLVAENKCLRMIDETFLVLKRDGFISVVKALPFNLSINCAEMTEDAKQPEWSKIARNAELCLSL